MLLQNKYEEFPSHMNEHSKFLHEIKIQKNQMLINNQKILKETLR